MDHFQIYYLYLEAKYSVLFVTMVTMVSLTGTTMFGEEKKSFTEQLSQSMCLQNLVMGAVRHTDMFMCMCSDL